MKKYLALLWLTLLAVGCSDSDDPNDPNNPPPVDKSANLLVTGASANDILSNSKYNRIVIEVAHVRNFRPTQQAMDDFVALLRARTFKEDIVVNYRELESPDEESLTLQEIANLETENRTEYNSGNTLAIYIYFADAPSNNDDEDNDTVTLGAVYRNTSMVVHEATVRRLVTRSAGFISLEDVESATLGHEFGHLFGLVNLGSAEVNSHEDTDSENHCNQAGCLMRAELQFGSGIMSMLKSRAGKGEVVPTLDAECILDLQANGGR
jgi:hypothetical protein